MQDTRCIPTFLTVDGKTREVVISREGIKSNTLLNSREHIINLAADFLCEDIQKYAQNIPKSS